MLYNSPSHSFTTPMKSHMNTSRLWEKVIRESRNSMSGKKVVISTRHVGSHSKLRITCTTPVYNTTYMHKPADMNQHTLDINYEPMDMNQIATKKKQKMTSTLPAQISPSN